MKSGLLLSRTSFTFKKLQYVHPEIESFVGYDMRFLDLMPRWLTEWTDTKDEITNSWDISYRLFRKTFTKGSIVLGNNTTLEKSVRLMYIVLIRESKK